MTDPRRMHATDVATEALDDLREMREVGHQVSRRVLELDRRHAIRDSPVDFGLVNQALALVQAAQVLLVQAEAHLEAVATRTHPGPTVKSLR